ncbi:MAG: ribosome silencing factor [Bacteroidetes bacterium]|nr:ribosome silencing factor [Bacteroidota bacterium]
MTSRILSKQIAELMFSKKATDVAILDLRNLTSITDYFVICSADSDTQVKAIADAIQDGMEKEGVSLYHIEGYQALVWVVLDYVDVVAHIFYREARTFYNLERLWGDAKRVIIKDSAKQKKEVEKKSTRKNSKKI